MAKSNKKPNPDSNSLLSRIQNNFRNRWIQVAILFVVYMGSIAVAQRKLIPKEDPKAKKEFKFMHCPNCEDEKPYIAGQEKQPCEKCKKKGGAAEKPAVYVGTTESIRDAITNSPTKDFNTFLGFATVFLLASLVFLGYKPKPKTDDMYFVAPCDHCGQRLRFRKVSLGQLGQCPRCRKILRFPDQKTAVREDIAIQWEQEQVKMRIAELEREKE